MVLDKIKMARKTFEFGGIQENGYETLFVNYKYGTKELEKLTKMLGDYGIKVVSSDISYDYSNSKRKLKSIKLKGFLQDPEEPKKLEMLILNRIIYGDDFQIDSSKLETVCGCINANGLEKYVLKNIGKIVRECARKRRNRQEIPISNIRENETSETDETLAMDSVINAFSFRKNIGKQETLPFTQILEQKSWNRNLKIIS